MGYDVLRRRCGACNTVHMDRSSCPNCIERRRNNAIALAGPPVAAVTKSSFVESSLPATSWKPLVNGSGLGFDYVMGRPDSEPVFRWRAGRSGYDTPPKAERTHTEPLTSAVAAQAPSLIEQVRDCLVGQPNRLIRAWLRDAVASHDDTARVPSLHLMMIDQASRVSHHIECSVAQLEAALRGMLTDYSGRLVKMHDSQRGAY
jgi:hypothetical protein